MDEFFRLVVLSMSMFVGCYLAGSVPLVLTLSEGVLRMTTTFSAGLLIGTALIIIIPEGVESLFSEVFHRGQSHINSHSLQPRLPLAYDNDIQAIDPKTLTNGMGAADIAVETNVEAKVAGTTDGYTVHELNVVMGLTLVLGFLFMMLVEHCGGGHAHSSAPLKMTNLEGAQSSNGSGQHNRKKLTATIGLVVHAAADGLALGAAAGLSKVDVELIIFLAIMLHKAPAAFGLTTFLMHEGYDRSSARRHLLIFSLAAPLAAFVAYFGLVRIMYTVQLPIPGVAMLFSAGTFLYVATVHVLNEVTHNSAHSPEQANSSGGNNGMARNQSKLSHLELLSVTFGALLPMLFNIIHSHEH